METLLQVINKEVVSPGWRRGLPLRLNLPPHSGSVEDRWGNTIEYRLLAEGKKYELRSAGPDGELVTDDDVVLSGPGNGD